MRMVRVAMSARAQPGKDSCGIIILIGKGSSVRMDTGDGER